MFDTIEDQGEAKDCSIGYMLQCQIFNALQEGQPEAN